MKHYCLRLLVFTSIVLIIIGSLVLIRTYLNRKMKWSLPQEIHVLFMGASHIERGVDDSLLLTAKNVSNSSERYLFTYLKLKYYLRDNHQIDTVFLQCAPTDLWENTDDKYHTDNEASHYVSLFCTLFEKDEFLVYKDSPSRLIGFYTKSLFRPKYYKKSGYFEQIGGYIGVKKNQKIMNPDNVVPQMIEGSYGHEINYYYLRKIISLCKENNVKLYFVYCPVYHPEYFYNQEYYYNAYNTYFSDVELLDYSHWEIPLDEYYDAHHLNHKGAQRFTNELKERFGLK